MLTDDEIRTLNRDLRILIASNGTLTRILGIVADDEIFVQILEQQVHETMPGTSGPEQPPDGRLLRRRILLRGRSSGHAYVAAESLIAMDLLPPAMTTSLTKTDCPIGEILAASRLETFKEAADVWVGPSPGWLAGSGCETPGAKTVGRRYRLISGGRPVMIITEYFLRNIFRDPS
ncbi:chorismate--pyruvate lyase family protein [Mycobacterium cookii]|nr:chorismate pyruvate-lyase family protein [Mycobacterium cookii]